MSFLGHSIRSIPDASPLQATRNSDYVRTEPSWNCTPHVGEEERTSTGKENKEGNFDEMLDSIEAPRFLDFEELIKLEGRNKEEEVEFGN
jgi:hypothetical protein